MALTTLVKNSLNRGLRHVNARVESLTVDRAEERRLRIIEATGYFDKKVFPLPRSFETMHYQQIVDEVALHAERFCDFDSPAGASNSFSFNNDFFFSPDAEVLYAVIRLYRPATLIEIGSGNSTKMAHQAIMDSGCKTRLVSIDPDPRVKVDDVADTSLRVPVESLDATWIASQLGKNDILLIDSSHILKPCGDVAFLYLRLFPMLPVGVLVHIHDIFIPYDYPREWVVDARWPWNEQYLVQSLLTFGEQFEVLWAGYHLQRTLPEFRKFFPRADGHHASSLWLRKRSDAATGMWPFTATSD